MVQIMHHLPPPHSDAHGTLHLAPMNSKSMNINPEQVLKASKARRLQPSKPRGWEWGERLAPLYSKPWTRGLRVVHLLACCLAADKDLHIFKSSNPWLAAMCGISNTPVPTRLACRTRCLHIPISRGSFFTTSNYLPASATHNL